MLRLATSVRTGVVSASLMLKRLGAYPRQNGLALALREIGRIERTLFTLDWLESPALRRQATAELNKGEARNALHRAVCFHRLGRLRDRSRSAAAPRQRPRPRHRRHRAVEHRLPRPCARRPAPPRRDDPQEGLLAHIAPLGWQHVNLTGDYLWTDNQPLDSDGYRPMQLRPTEPLAAAA